MPTRREACVAIGGVLIGTASAGSTRMTGGALGAWTDGLVRAGPAVTGVDPGAILAFLDACAAENLELDSFMLYRGGHVAAEGWWWPYRPSLAHMLHSATKSFTGTGVGIAIAEGRLTLNDPILNFFPGRVANPSANLKAMTVEHLLTQTSGHAIGISGSQWRTLTTSWVDEFFKVPVRYMPGTHFAYSSATSYMLSAILTRVTGQPLAEYLRPRLFEPMAMHGVHWDVGPERINPGGNGLSTTTADFLKLGALHLAGGTWKGQRLLPKAWVDAVATPKFTPNYSYQWWLAPNDLGYYAAGKFGQFCFVFPGLDGVLTFTAGVADNLATRERVHALAFKHAPMMMGGKSTRSAEQRLKTRVESLCVLPSFRAHASELAPQVSGRTFACADNADGVHSVRLTFDRSEAQFELIDSRGTHIVRNGLRTWRESETTITGGYLHHEYEPERMRVVAGGHWGTPDRFDMTWQFIESGFRDAASLTFDGDTVRYDRRVNINSGPLARPTIPGRAVPAGATA